MEYRDYYKILGVDRKASEKEIRKAYRSLARKYHPDVNPGDPKAEEKFKEINEAYEVLSNEDKRAKYDQLGRSYEQWQRTGGQPGGFDWSQWTSGAQPGGGYRVEFTDADLGGEDLFSDFFRNIFGGGMGSFGGFETGRRTTRQASQRGQDLEVNVPITLEEAAHGTTRTLQVGSRQINVKIPAGAGEGTRVRLRGQGEPGFGNGQAGDLYVVTQMIEHPVFRREGDDLHTDLKIPLYTAVLGGEVRVQTLDGPVTLRIQPGTQSGRTVRLRNKGMPKLRRPDERGDLYAHVLVQVPTDLNEREKALFENLRAMRS